MIYDLPIAYECNGIVAPIRNNGDYRVILDLIIALNDPNLTDDDKIYCTLKIFYEDCDVIPNDKIEDAVKFAFAFIGGSDEVENNTNVTKPKLMDWEQDFKDIVSPVNRVLGTEIRSLPYLHWWTFLSAYYEIGDCFFAQKVNIRNKKAKGKKLEKYEEEFYKMNYDKIKLKTKTTDAEDEMMKEALGY